MNKDDQLYMSIKNRMEVVPLQIKKRYKRNGTLEYLINDKNKIKEWNKKHRLLQFTFFQLKIKLVSDYKKKMDELFLKNVLPMTKFLDNILKHGWQWGILSISDYNMIVYFQDFCKKMSKIEKKKNISSNDFFQMEEAFLKITYKTGYSDKLLKALENILFFYKKLYFKDTDEIKEILKKLEYFFIPNYYYPSFFDLIQAYNITYFKKYIDLSSLKKTNLNVINNKFYHCSRDIFVNIAKYIKNLAKEIKLIETEIERITWLKESSEIKSNEGPEKIIKFYKSFGYNWDKDQEDLFLLLLLLTEEIIKKLNFLLTEQFTIMNNQEQIIQLYIINDNKINEKFEIIKTNFELAKEKYNSIVPTKFTVKEFMRVQYPESLFSDQDHKYIFIKFTKIFNELKGIAYLLKKIYNTNMNDSQLTYMITSPKEWQGKPVFHIYNYYSELFLQICGYFKDNELKIEIQRLNSLQKRLKSKKEKMESIQGKDEYIKKLFD